MTHKPQDIGANRTGMATSPIDSKRMLENAEVPIPESSAGVEKLGQFRTELGKTWEPIGTMPPPGSLKGAAKTLLEGIKGKDANVFINLVAERLAFERTGTRFYEALLAKFDAASVHETGFAREDLERIRDEELQHVGLLWNALEKLGADPTVMTPSADVAGVASEGVLKVLVDPRTTFTEALEAILIAELVDNDCWLVLSDLAERLGMEELAAQFRQALNEEEDHLARIRHWLTSRIDGQIGLEPKAPSAAPAHPPA